MSGRVDDVGVADHPAHVGGGPPDVARRRSRRCWAATRPSRRRGRRCRGRCPWASRWCRRCTGRTAGRWPRPRRTRRARCGPTVIATSQSRSRPSTMDGLDLRPLLDARRPRAGARRARGPCRGTACTRRPGSARCRSSPMTTTVGRGVVDPDRQLVGREAAEDHRVHGADPGAGQHRDHRLGDHRHVDDDPVALLHAQGAQHPTERRHLRQQLGVGEGTAWCR